MLCAVNSGPRRLNRLPQRLDYTLIPPPLGMLLMINKVEACIHIHLSDLSRPLVDEKSALPAIIVTPSSPSGDRDFAIAFLAPIQKPTIRERVSHMLPSVPKLSTFQARLPSQIRLPSSPYKSEFDTSSSWSLKARASTTILMAILVFIMGCHLLLHSLASHHPRLDYGTAAEDSVLSAVFSGNVDNISGAHRDPSDSATPSFGGAFNLHALWAPGHTIDGKRHAHFVSERKVERKANPVEDA